MASPSKPLWSSAHHWHFVGATNTALTLNCCSCDYAMMVQSLGAEFLRYSLMDDRNVVGIGRGLLVNDCNAGQRQIEIDGYEEGCSRAGQFGLERLGLLESPISA